MSLKIKDIKKGDLFWEKCWQFEALEDGYKSGTIKMFGEERDQWRVLAKNVKTGEEINFLKTDSQEHYGPVLDKECMYTEVKTLEELANRDCNTVPLEIDLEEFTKDQLIAIILASNLANKPVGDWIVDTLTTFCEQISSEENLNAK